MGSAPLKPLCLLLLLASLVWVGRAQAYEEQLVLGASAGYAHALDARAPHGALFDVAANVGLDPAWALRLRASYGLHPSDTDAVHVVGAQAGLLYMLDVLELVPYAGVAAGGLARFDQDDPQLDLTLGPVLGADYLVSRDLAFQLDLQARVLMSDLERVPVYFGATFGALWFFDL